MIYRNEVLVNWKNPKDSDDKIVRDQIIEIENKFYSDKTHKVVKILYPRGEPKMEHGGGFEILKIFPIPLKSSDGEWRWSKSRMSSKTKTNPSGFVDHHLNIRHQHVLTEKDKEFLWFLMHHSSMLNKSIFLEDIEGKAKEKVEAMATDADIKFMLMGKSSPIAKDEKLIREVAAVFGVRDIDKMQLNELKLKLYDAVLEGEKAGDKFVNFEKFEEITQGNTLRKEAFVTRTAINDKIVGYKDRAWWIMSGRSFEEKLMEVKPSEAAFRDQVLIDEVIKNPSVRDRLFSVMGESVETTIETLREMDRGALQRKYRDLTGEFKNIKKEELVELLCEKLEIEYVEQT